MQHFALGNQDRTLLMGTLVRRGPRVRHGCWCVQGNICHVWKPRSAGGLTPAGWGKLGIGCYRLLQSRDVRQSDWSLNSAKADPSRR